MWPTAELDNRNTASRYPAVSLRPGAACVYVRIRHRMSELSLGEALRLGIDLASLLVGSGDRQPSDLHAMMALQLEYPGGLWPVEAHGVITVEPFDSADPRVWLRFSDGEAIAIDRLEGWGVVASLSRLLDHCGALPDPTPGESPWLN